MPHVTKRHVAEYTLGLHQSLSFKTRMLNWAKQFSIHIFLDNNGYPNTGKGYECILAAGALDILSASDKDILSELNQLHTAGKDWVFGHICYDYKNLLEPRLVSRHPATVGFPLACFFVPKTIIHINRECNLLTIESFHDPDDIYKALEEETIKPLQPLPCVGFTSLFDKTKYEHTVERLRQHIADGDCYEINFCNKGFCENVDIDPIEVFHSLNALSPAPFAAYYRLNELYMMCASPERYLKKDGQRIVSQPIKGTARRDKDPVRDQEIKDRLKADIKERAENVMIVDLVRNDLARSCAVGSVKVDELFGIYSFPQVHQMISTVSGALRKNCPFTDAIRYSFPMGSMTGAPKYKVMQLIDEYELCRRELFSGTIGYITPSGDFDFNVIIRTLFYNAATRYLCYQTGGAITYDSVPTLEWEEMRLKAWAIERIFSG